MFLFRVDRQLLKLEFTTDPTAHITDKTVIVNGKKRDRETKRYIWCETIEDATIELDKAVTKTKRELVSKIATLNHQLESLEGQTQIQAKSAREGIREYNNTHWE
jgi:hypothetical protein